MIYAKMIAGHAVAVLTEAEIKALTSADWAMRKIENRNDWRTMEQAEQVAADLTGKLGVRYITTDAGKHVSPRYDVIACPVVGAEISYAFNGDSYPDGKIKSISASLKRIESDTGRVYFRRRLSGAWISEGTWSMQYGHVSTYNRSV